MRHQHQAINALLRQGCDVVDHARPGPLTTFGEPQFSTPAEAWNRSGAGGSPAPVGSLAIGRFLTTVVVTVHGAVDRPASAALAATLGDLIDGQGNLAVVVDLRDVCGIDRSGVDALSAAAARIAARGGELRLGGPSGAVFDSLTAAGLGKLFTVSLEQAHRPRSVGRRGAGSSRPTSRDAHPAGSALYPVTDPRDRN